MRDKTPGNGKGGPTFRSGKPLDQGGVSHEFLEALKDIRAPEELIDWAEGQQSVGESSGRQIEQKEMLDKAEAAPGVVDFLRIYDQYRDYFRRSEAARKVRMHYSTGGNA